MRSLNRIVNVHPRSCRLPGHARSARPSSTASASRVHRALRRLGRRYRAHHRARHGAVLDDDDEATLGARILKKEHELLPLALQWIADGKVTIEQPKDGRPRLESVDERKARTTWSSSAAASAR